MPIFDFEKRVRISRHAGVEVLAIVLASFLAFSSALAHAAEGRPIRARISPVYPEIAKRLNLFGEVKIEVTVNSEGKVIAVKTVDGNRILSESAETAVRGWRFEPGPATTTEDLEISFPHLR
jgi:TonB family protein